MKKLLLSIIMTIPLISFSQMEKGNILLETGFGVGGYETDLRVAGFNPTTDGAAPATFFLSGKYAFGGRFALGLNLSTGSYLQDEEDKNKGDDPISYGQLAISARGVIVNKDKLQFYTDLNFTSTVSTDDSEVLGTANGGGIELMPGINYYLGKRAGLFFQLGIASYEQKGEFLNTIDYTWSFGGIQSRLGAAFRF